MKVRESIKVFSVQMERVMQEHDEDQGDSWKKEDIRFLLERAEEELKEARVAFDDCDPIKVCLEVIDMANFFHHSFV